MPMVNLRQVYAEKGLEQIPRLLSLMDRNPYSKTYGCMDRTYWLDKAIDFPSSIAQFGVHALALAYTHNFPQNPYYRKRKIFEWCVAAMEYWVSIQKNDGSFDEFYPNERGWAGPTGFLLYAMLGSFELLEKGLEQQFKEKFLDACKKAALYLAKYDEVGVLANHHAMALLPIYYCYKVTGDKSLLFNFDQKWREFLSYQNEEGWFLEYDGADPGYLSATVSFLGKLYQLLEKGHEEKKRGIEKAVEKAIRFASHFAYPNKHYAGTIGSRQTLHFYPHGFEIFGKKFPLALAVAQKMLEGLTEGKLVPPSIMPDRYLVYRVPEMLLSYISYTKRKRNLEKLPWEQEKSLSKYFHNAKMMAIKRKRYYAVLNLAKGGVIKIFSLKTGKLVYNNCGTIGKTADGKRISTQWIGGNFDIVQEGNRAAVKGRMYSIDSQLPTPFKMAVFRLLLIALGWNTKLAYKLKGVIRSMIILKNKEQDTWFENTFEFNDSSGIISNKIGPTSQNFTQLQVGGEFSVRYVPQSLYFQPQELGVGAHVASNKELKELNRKKEITFSDKVEF